MNSNFLNLNLNDLLKGVIVAVLTALVTGLGTVLSSGTLPDLAALQSIGLAALAAGLAYLGKNLITNSAGEPMKSEPQKQITK